MFNLTRTSCNPWATIVNWALLAVANEEGPPTKNLTKLGPYRVQKWPRASRKRPRLNIICSHLWHCLCLVKPVYLDLAQTRSTDESYMKYVRLPLAVMFAFSLTANAYTPSPEAMTRAENRQATASELAGELSLV